MTAHARAPDIPSRPHETNVCPLPVLFSRERFANGLRIYGIDQDEQQGYAGRFCDYLEGSRVPIRTKADAEAFTLDQVDNPGHRHL